MFDKQLAPESNFVRVRLRIGRFVEERAQWQRPGQCAFGNPRESQTDIAICWIAIDHFNRVVPFAQPHEFAWCRHDIGAVGFEESLAV